MSITLYDAPRCPFCARTRIVLAEKGIPYDTVTIDLEDRPAWILERNPPDGRVPIIEEDGWLLPESVVIDEYLEERFPEPALLPADPARRALVRLQVERFDDVLGDHYYAFRRGEPNQLAERLQAFDPPEWGLAAISYLPWVIRARDMLGVELPPHVSAWLDEVSSRPSVREERELVEAL
jgi:glutathione S-transferase